MGVAVREVATGRHISFLDKLYKKVINTECLHVMTCSWLGGLINKQTLAIQHSHTIDSRICIWILVFTSLAREIVNELKSFFAS